MLEWPPRIPCELRFSLAVLRCPHEQGTANCCIILRGFSYVVCFRASFGSLSPVVLILSINMNHPCAVAGFMASIASWKAPYELEERKPAGHIQVAIPFWIYSRINTFLFAIQSSAKPEEYIVSILEGHAGRLNL